MSYHHPTMKMRPELQAGMPALPGGYFQSRPDVGSQWALICLILSTDHLQTSLRSQAN